MEGVWRSWIEDIWLRKRFMQFQLHLSNNVSSARFQEERPFVVALPDDAVPVAYMHGDYLDVGIIRFLQSCQALRVGTWILVTQLVGEFIIRRSQESIHIYIATERAMQKCLKIPGCGFTFCSSDVKRHEQ